MLNRLCRSEVEPVPFCIQTSAASWNNSSHSPPISSEVISASSSSRPRISSRISVSNPDSAETTPSLCCSINSVYQPMSRSVSSVERYAPCIRTGSLCPGGRNSMSPFPSRASAPFWSRIVRESVLDATRKAIRVGKFALMRPVITFTDGRWVATIKWIPIARAFWAS